MVNGSRKGGAYERVLAVLLSLWVSANKREDLFWRTPGSGGRSTRARTRNVRLTHAAGDIAATSPGGHWLVDNFLIEAKNYKKFDWQNDLYNPQSIEPKKSTKRPLCIAAHTREEAEFYGRPHWMALVRENHRPDLLLTDAKGLHVLSACGAYEIPLLASFPDQDFVVFRLDSLIPGVPFRHVRHGGRAVPRPKIVRRHG